MYLYIHTHTHTQTHIYSLTPALYIPALHITENKSTVFFFFCILGNPINRPPPSTDHHMSSIP